MRRSVCAIVLVQLFACTNAASPLPPAAKPQSAPAVAASGDEAVLAEVRDWLAHPNEYGQPPERAAIVWRGERDWPFHDKPENVYLVEFAYADGNRGIALAGPVTWTFLEIDFARFAHEDLVKLYAGWYLQFVMINDPKGQEAQRRKLSDGEIASLLTAQGFTAIDVTDSVQIGDDTYVAALATKDGARVVAAGRAHAVKTYDPTMPQMKLPPLYWYLGSTFYDR
ncbi:MAG: hypothetical protein HOV81_15150 [Kofleriaceae bacterium]|nr:hypothetical protein [Kofleriaceae bacterium]